MLLPDANYEPSEANDSEQSEQEVSKKEPKKKGRGIEFNQYYAQVPASLLSRILEYNLSKKIHYMYWYFVFF